MKNAKKEKMIGITIVSLILIGVSRWETLKYANASFSFFGIEFGFDIGSTPYSNCFKLLLGMIVARFFCEKNEQTKRETKRHIFNIILAVTLFFHWAQNSIISTTNCTWWLSIVNVCITCIFLFVIASGWGGKIDNFLSTAIMRFLGKLSMYIYLFHYPVIAYAEILRNKIFGGTINNIVILVEFFFVIVVTMLLSIFLENIKNKRLY